MLKSCGVALAEVDFQTAVADLKRCSEDLSDRMKRLCGIPCVPRVAKMSYLANLSVLIARRVVQRVNRQRSTECS